MLKLETVFGAAATVTPDLAARIASQASKFDSKVYLEFGSTQLCVDSLIGILAMNVRRGTKLVVAADGADAADAAQCIAALLSEAV